MVCSATEMSLDYFKSNTAYPSLSPLCAVPVQVISKEAGGSSFVCEQKEKKQLPLNGKTKQKPSYLKYWLFPHNIYPPTWYLSAQNLNKDKRDLMHTPSQKQTKENKKA